MPNDYGMVTLPLGCMKASEAHEPHSWWVGQLWWRKQVVCPGYENNWPEPKKVMLHNWPKPNLNQSEHGFEIYQPAHKHFYRIHLTTEHTMYFRCAGCPKLKLIDRKWMYFQMMEQNYRPQDNIYHKAQ